MTILSSSSRRFLSRITAAPNGSRSNVIYRCHPRLLGTTNRSALQDYLDGFIGLPPPNKGTNGNTNNNTAIHNNNPVMRARTAMAQGPLLLSGTSYLIPTLRLERHETPQSLTKRLEQASPDDAHNKTADSPAWCCPIILDASALAPDGSPHYQPPPPGSLTEMIAVLSTFGIHVIGISKLSSQFAEEAAQAGIPSLWAPRRAGADPKYDISQVLQLVQQKKQEQHKLNNEQPRTNPKDSPKLDALKSETEFFSTQSTLELAEKDSTENTSEKVDISADKTLIENTSSNKSDDLESPKIPSVEFSSSSTLYHGSVRSGQQVLSAKGQSLVIVGSVNSGGEVLSDGDIFVFGKLRGRAFAGLGTAGDNSDNDNDNTTTPARIVATSFDAELVAIGDIFTTIDKVENLVSDKQLQAGQAIMVTRLDGDGDQVPILQFSSVPDL